MEVKINREIRNYTEAMFFGLSLRQFIFSICACGVAVGIYFLLKPYVGTETVSWMCILGAAPFAALGFIKYNGMTAEKFVWAWIKSEFLMPKQLVFHSTNTYLELFKPSIEQKGKISLKALGVDLIAWPVAFILTFLIVTYANDLAQYISGYFFVSACLLADGISVYKFKGDFLNEKNVGEEGYYLLKVRMYVGLGLGAIAFCGMIVSLIRYLIHLL